MSDINRQEALDAICTWGKVGIDEHGNVVRWHDGLVPYVRLSDIVLSITNLPSVHKKGTWIDDPLINNCCVCSVCNIRQDISAKYLFSFCPNCGSDMRERKEKVKDA